MELPILLAIDTTGNWKKSGAVLGDSELAIELAQDDDGKAIPDTDGKQAKYLLVGDGNTIGSAARLKALRAKPELIAGLPAAIANAVGAEAQAREQADTALENKKQDKLTAIGTGNLLTAPAAVGGQPGAKAVADFVQVTGAQTVAGVKTFSSIPELPSSNPATDNQAVRKAYVNAQDNALSERINAEAQTRAQADNVLQKNIDDEAQARQSAIVQAVGAETENREAALTAEQQERQGADKALQDAIEAEEQERRKADKELQDTIETEQMIREQEDKNLQEAINLLVPENLEDLPDLLASKAPIDSPVFTGVVTVPEKAAPAGDSPTVVATEAQVYLEEQTRAQADTALQNNINAEAQTRAQADNVLQRNIETEEQARQQGLTGKQSKVITATCATAAATVAKVVTISGYTLTTGDIIAITFTNGSTAANATININSSGAKAVSLGGGAPTGASGTGAHYIATGRTALYYYNGTYMCLLGSQDITDTEGLTAVSHDTSLSGSGTSASPLSVVNKVPASTSGYLLTAGGTEGVFGTPVNPATLLQKSKISLSGATLTIDLS